MTRLPPDSFLSSGAMEAELELSLTGLAGSHGPSSVISPLSLPGGVQYFEPMTRPSVTSYPSSFAAQAHAWSPINGLGSADPPRAQPASFLSPHLTPIPSHAQYQLQFQRHPQQRAASLSPTRGPSRRRRHGAADGKMDVDLDLTKRGAPSGVSVPVDTIQGTGSGLITVRRPAVRVNPTLDSVMLDSQCSAAEQDYRRLERMRQAFDDERRHLQASRDRAEEVYREIIEELEEDHARQRSQWEAEKFQLQTQVMQLQSRLKEVELREKAASDPKSPTFHPGPSSQITSPTGQAGLPPLASRDTSSTDTAVVDTERPSKVIDVQEYHKDLEGIHLKEKFVKMETFTDTPSGSGSDSKPSSGGTSPPQNPDDTKALARARSIRALRADAHSRLTMHAGHTPTVSLSIAHTGTTNTVVSSGSNTPTLLGGDGAMSSDGNEYRDESSEPAEPVPTGIDDDHAPAILEPSDEDPELKGPLTLRNMPAKDEIFLKKLSDKLEKAASEDGATPTVLKYSDDEGDGDETNTEVGGGGDGDAGDAGDVEEVIPLKLRNTSSNFGKPFGVA